VLIFSALSSHAAQLATAKVIEITGTVTKYSTDGSNAPLKVGDILVQGDSVSTTAMSSTNLVFSNGSELTVEENTSLTIATMEQAPFHSSQSYEQLAADPSQSQTLLELNYGELNGHVKKLQSGSRFDIQTPLGTAAIRGTTYNVRYFFNATRNESILSVTNIDGLIDIISRFSGPLEFSGNVADKGYDNTATEESAEPIPASHTVIIRNYETESDLPLPAPTFTPEDPGVIVVSPES
jgi:hypothetical protein